MAASSPRFSRRWARHGDDPAARKVGRYTPDQRRGRLTRAQQVANMEQGIDAAVAGDMDACRIDPFRPQRLRGALRRGEMKVGQHRDDAAIAFLGQG